MRRTLVGIALLVAASALGSAPLAAQPDIVEGVDVFDTSNGTQVDFSFDPLPADFFCPGSAPFTGIVNLRGVPLATSPAGAAGSADTIIERLNRGVFVGGVARIDVVLRALSLAGTGPISVYCPGQGYTTWNVSACRCNLQPTNQIEVRMGCSSCGRFTGQLRMNVCLTFTNTDTGERRGPIQRLVTLAMDSPWCYQPGSGGLRISDPFGVDTNCDGAPDLAVRGTTNFFPGWGCTTLGADCWAQYAHLTHCHENYTNPDAHDHCINPVCYPRTN